LTKLVPLSENGTISDKTGSSFAKNGTISEQTGSSFPKNVIIFDETGSAFRKRNHFRRDWFQLSEKGIISDETGSSSTKLEPISEKFFFQALHCDDGIP
jgi:hypothetical protein